MAQRRKTVEKNPQIDEINIPVEVTKKEDVPTEITKKEDIPMETAEKIETPEVVENKIKTPSEIKENNCITVNGVTKEIKPTKFAYFRNKTANIYKMLKMIPLGEFLSYDKGTFDDERTSDQILFDFLIAVFDDPDFVKANYDDFTMDDLDRMLEIFGRINHIDEKEKEAEERKNRQAQMNR